MKRVTPKLLFILLLALATLVVMGAAAGASGVHGSIAGHVTTVHNVSLADVRVVLVNASNTSEEISGFNTTVDQSGYFQFTSVPNGTYQAYAWGPYLSAGLSNNITVEDNVTYTCSVILTAEPYYGNITVSQNPIPLGSGMATVTITAYDFWNYPVGPGWMISVHTTAGTLDPPYGLTDTNSQFRTTLTAPDNGSSAEIQEFARGSNGLYYPLQKREEASAATPTPTASPTAQPTATVQPTVTPTTSATPSPTAQPTVTAKPTPGFEMAAALIGMALVALCLKRK